MVILGKCPQCGANDSFLVNADTNSPEFGNVSCRRCKLNLGSWVNFAEQSQVTEVSLIPVLVTRSKYQVELTVPQKRGVPCYELVERVLHKALMEKFGLRGSFVAEGGMEGTYKDEPIELRYIEDNIGLTDEHRFPKNRGCLEILKWYESLLRLIFERELTFGALKFGRGAILRSNPEGIPLEVYVRFVLTYALCKVNRTRGFVERVFEELDSGWRVN
jgi:hypothetical protein